VEKQIYNKLVRDRIPEIITRSGRQWETSTTAPAEFDVALREKLVAEATEAKDADASHLVTELADIQEVMQTLMQLHGITTEMVQREQEKRRQERGGFEKRLTLVWAECETV
jgi:predicted house-cleaning noncanonical NTP pyrophosphatase (MazG superfamily)